MKTRTKHTKPQPRHFDRIAPDDPSPLTGAAWRYQRRGTVRMIPTRQGVVLKTRNRSCELDSAEGRDWLVAVSLHAFGRPPFKAELDRVVEALTYLVDFELEGAA